MGTSNSNGGPGNRTPLIPSWLEPDASGPPAESAPATDNDHGSTQPVAPPPVGPIQSIIPNRFSSARNNFSRFVGSGGQDRSSLGRAVSHYVSTASGGAHIAAQRMGSSRVAGGRLLGFLSDAVARGAREALKTLDLEILAGRPIEDIFLGLADYVCPESGTVDEGIARDAFIETIAELAENGITDLDALTVAQMETVFELYATHAIEGRLYNDIGSKMIVLPSDVRQVENVQEQLSDFIRRGVSDALESARGALQLLTPERLRSYVDQVYRQAFTILQQLSAIEARRI